MSKVVRSREQKMLELDALIKRGDPREVPHPELGCTTWQQAPSLHSQLSGFAPAPAYGRTSETDEEMSNLPVHAQLSMQGTFDTPQSDLPVTFPTYVAHLVNYHCVNPCNPRSTYPLTTEEGIYHQTARRSARIPRTDDSQAQDRTV